MRNLLLVVFLFTAGIAAGAEPSAHTQTKTFLEILVYGWQINLVLGALAFLALFLAFHSILSTRTESTIPQSLRRMVLDDIASGDIEAAQGRLGSNTSLFSQVVLPGLKMHDHPLERIHQAMEGAGRRAIGALRQEVNYLANIGVLCPMLGLLGTVLGLLKAFNVMGAEEMAEGSKSIVMTSAIGEAMGTTAVGLLVGIPAMAIHYLCMSRVGRIGDEVEIAAEEVTAALGEMK